MADAVYPYYIMVFPFPVYEDACLFLLGRCLPLSAALFDAEILILAHPARGPSGLLSLVTDSFGAST